MKLSLKGHILIPVTREQLLEKLDSPGICDGCSAVPMKGFLIAVLNSFYCEQCTAEWEEVATYYEEDRAVEENNYEYFVNQLR